MITGLVNQSLLNIHSDDFGGELDSGGQDEVCFILRRLLRMNG